MKNSPLIYKLKSYLGVLRLTPFSLETESGRVKERYRLAAIAAATNFFYKIALMVVMVFAVRMTIPYLGIERYGIWITISGLAALLNFLDLGVGNALINRVAQVTPSPNDKKLCDSVSGGLAALGLISLIIGSLFYLLVILIPWDAFLKITDEKIYLETLQTIKIFSIIFAINIFADGISKVFYGVQRVYEANLFRTIGAFLSLFFIWYAIQANGEMPSLLIASMSGAILANLALMMLLLARKQFSLNNIFGNAKDELPHLVKSGGLFFFLQIGVTVLGSIDNLIIANYLGAATVAMYSVVQKLFQLSTQPSLMINNGLWPAYANAKKHGDRDFILKTFKRSIIFTLLVSGTLGLILVFFGSTIISYWTHGDLVVPYTLLAAYCIWSTVDTVSNAFGMYLNGLSLLKPQVKGLVTLIALGLPLKIYLLSQFGIESMLIGFSVFFLANHLFWAGYVYRDLIFKKI